ncbi:MAG: DUF5666 domain-containing protein [Acidobacteriia bacterium]|nr:DUF5666 domain-containing protein [Terriglobia bacterium]
MRKEKWFEIAVLSASLFLGGCSVTQSLSTGGGTQPPPQPTAGTSTLSVTLSDAPPAGVSVLSFEVNITGALLQPMVGADFSLLPGGDPVEIEVKKLETEAAVLSTLSAPAGTYKGLQLTLAHPALTVFNGSPSDIGACKVNTTCRFQPAAAGPITYTSAPFPLTLVAGTPVGLKIDILLNKIIATDLSVTLNDPSDFVVTELTPVPVSGGPGRLDDNEFAGLITSIDATNNKFTVQNANSAMSETILAGTRTKFEDFDDHGCKTSNFSCLAVSQLVEVETTLQSDGSLIAKEVKLEESRGARSLEGTLVSVTGAPPTQLQMVVLDREGDDGGPRLGDALLVSITPTTTFDIQLGGLAVPAGGAFAGPGDLIPGQDLQIEPGTITAGPPISTSTAHVHLHTSQFTATVSGVNGSAITVTKLPAIFGVATLTVQTSSATEFEDLLGPSSLTNGTVISVRGLLFKTATGPVVVAAKVRKRDND